MTCEIRGGGIYKLPFPFTDLSSRKARPALALGEPDQQGDVRFLFITTTPVTEKQSLMVKNAASSKREIQGFSNFYYL